MNSKEVTLNDTEKLRMLRLKIKGILNREHTESPFFEHVSSEYHETVWEANTPSSFIHWTLCQFLIRDETYKDITNGYFWRKPYWAEQVFNKLFRALVALINATKTLPVITNVRWFNRWSHARQQSTNYFASKSRNQASEHPLKNNQFSPLGTTLISNIGRSMLKSSRLVHHCFKSVKLTSSYYYFMIIIYIIWGNILGPISEHITR